MDEREVKYQIDRGYFGRDTPPDTFACQPYSKNSFLQVTNLRGKMDISNKAEEILCSIKSDLDLAQCIDPNLAIPKPFVGTGEIKIIVLGQDPTVKNEKSRGKITTVLNLNTNGSVCGYLSKVCTYLGISLVENVYATNLYKNFFTQPPTTIVDCDIFQKSLNYWLPLLLEEIAVFGDIPIITLGEPILKVLVHNHVPSKVNYYWGYRQGWQEQEVRTFRFIKSEDNRLCRTIFPFPHQPSIRKDFYRFYLEEFTQFVRALVFTGS